MGLLCGFFGTRGTQWRLRDAVEASLVNRGATVAAETILAVFDTLQGEVDAGEVARRMRQSLFTARSENLLFVLTTSQQVADTVVDGALCAHCVLQ